EEDEEEEDVVVVVGTDVVTFDLFLLFGC
ncbi:hypothetical protein A2U01_0107011, partial [Trifolium medium]|nr:hypothetical protein [Trifolium medium]